MPATQDGPSSPHFTPLPLSDGIPFEDLPAHGISAEMAAIVPYAPTNSCIAWGIPFEITGALLVKDQPLSLPLLPTRAPWLVFLHTADWLPPQKNQYGFFSPMRGAVPLAEKAANYILCYEDGAEIAVPIFYRHQLGYFKNIRWGEPCFQAVQQPKPYPEKPSNEPKRIFDSEWGLAQTRVSYDNREGIPEHAWTNWLWAWQNPCPEKTITGLRIEPGLGSVVLSAVSAGTVADHPLRWQARQKTLLHLEKEEAFKSEPDSCGLLVQIQLDLGQVISAVRRPVYLNSAWEQTAINTLPDQSRTEILVEYTAHPEACFHLSDGSIIPVQDVNSVACNQHARLECLPPARQRVKLRVVEKANGRPAAVKLHIHGEQGEYLPPLDRHRMINPDWFEDFSVDFAHQNRHYATYIPGETTVNLPLEKIYVEISKGFEIRPVHKVIEVTSETREITFEIERVLPWRSRGWVTADTHVHFLSPVSAMLEGAAEGVNVVNLLASQWGELMTNVGDFDGQTTWGSPEAGGGPEGDGEYLVRVGTENRQRVLGHISLLGYRGPIIAPMTVGGPNESALGDPVEALLMDWARQCKRQSGLVVLPHFPNPRGEQAAVIALEESDAVEMTSWENLHGGIDPYSLSDWYRYLSCGHHLPAVGGTDKMNALTAIGAIRTYAHLKPGEPFTYERWMAAIRSGETFVTYGPLLEWAVEGRPAGSRLDLPPGGGRVDVTWQVASVTIPVTQVELVVNGEIRHSQSLTADGGSGNWSVAITGSSWLALLVRGKYPGQVEMIAAHSSAVMVQVDGASLFSASDAITILDQIEGALAYLDTVGTRAADQTYKRLRLELTAAHRRLHNRLHQQGYFHTHVANPDEEMR